LNENNELQPIIEMLWEKRDSLGPDAPKEARQPIEWALGMLDAGVVRVAERGPEGWTVNQWLKKAVLLSFRLNAMETIAGGPDGANWWDKVPSKFLGWDAKRFTYVGEGTMVDTWATVGSCAQIGRNVHISGGAGIGGVLEPLQAGPVIIEDDCFIGARSEVAEGVVVEKGAVLSMGVFLGASTKIVDRATGEVMYGRVPAYSVVVPGSLPGKDGGPSLACAVIVKRVDERTRSKTGINELLRD
jgi:2,3,4,5-tetrahydropyridine-2-carboxylate N-succinyltransferase